MVKSEAYYRGEGGRAYLVRNRQRLSEERVQRREALRGLVAEPWRSKRWLEVGAGIGTNLAVGDVGVDIDPRVVADMAYGYTPIGLIGRAQSMPFVADQSFAVVLSVGVLMHLPDGEYQQAVAEMLRISKHYVIVGEYVAEHERDLLWHGEPGLLWERWYETPLGWWELRRTAPLPPFDRDVTFLVWEHQ